MFFLPFCLVWNLAVQGCSLPLNPPLSPGIVCMSDCVTQSGSPGVRVSVAQCVSCYQEEKLCVKPKIKEIISDFGWMNWDQHDNSGKLEFEQPSYLVICW